MRSRKYISPATKRKVKLLKTAARGAAHFALLEKYKKRRRFFLAFQSLGVVSVFVLTLVLQTYLQIKPPSYDLNPAARSLVGESRDDAATYLKDDVQSEAFNFSVPKATDDDASVHTGRVADAYEATLSKNASDGIAVIEKTSQIAVGLTPMFKTYEGRRVDGDHIVYLAAGGIKLVYTLKYNGLKEDIIVPSYRGDALEYGFELSLPTGVEARLDESGNIGIYSSDPSLFGEVSFGSDEDRARVEKARENGEKNHLVMTIPYPIVKDASGMEYTDKSVFRLGDKQQKTMEVAVDPKLPAEVQARMKASTTKNVYSLAIASQGLKDLNYPISIDPTMQVTSAGDFGGVNNESGVEVDTTNSLIRRAGLTGGINTVTATTFGVAGQTRFCEATVAYNGYMYVTGGFDTTGNTSQNTSYYVPIGANGNITTSFINGPNLPNLNHCHQMVARDGFIYVLGGYRGAAVGDVWRSKIGTDGSMGSWTVLGGIGTGHYSGDAEIVGDYVYIIGGGSNAIRYAKFQADGSLSAWASTTASYPGPSTITHGTQMASYNGVLYVSGGYNASGQGSFQNGIYYARPASTGNVAAWTTGPTMPQAKGGHVMEQFGGYLYVAAGCTGRGILGDCDAETGAVFFVQIHADGSLGTWRNNNVGTAAVIWSDSAHYNGVWYRVGGCNSASINFGQCDAAGNQVMGISYFTPRPVGEVYNSGWSATNTLPGARAYFGSTVHNGYIYVSGGYNTAYASATDTVYYGAIASNGTVTWSTDGDSTLPTVRVGHTMVAWNGYMYLVGGRNYDGSVLHNTVHYAAINSNGSLGTWSSAGTAFTTSRHLHQSAVYNGYLYVLGGCSVADCGVTPNSRLNTVQYAKLASNGVLENSGSCTPWCTAATGFNAARDAFVTHAYNSRIYVLGGADDGGTGYRNDTQFAALSSDGSLVADNPDCVGTATWCTSTSFTTARWGLASDIHKGYMYIMGGQGSGGQLNDVQYAIINDDGTLGTWATTQSFTTIRTAHGGAIYAGNVYIFGGDSGGGVQGGVQYQAVFNGGSGLATHTTTITDGTNWGSGRHGHDSVYLNGYIYIASGRSNDCTIGCTYPMISSIRKGVVAADGTFDSWVTAADIPDGGRMNHQMVAVNGYMFVIAGGNSSLTPQNTVYRASINPTDGSLGSWDTLANFPIQVRDHTANVFGDAIVVTGGLDQTNTTLDNTYYATVDANGNLSSWTATAALPGERRFHAAVGVGNNLYVLGGLDAPNNTIYNDVQVADVASTGALSNWRRVGTLPSGRHAHLAAAANGFLYFGQGCNGTTATAVTTCSSNAIDDLWVASVGSNGDIGKWVVVGGGLDGARIQTTSEVINGRLYTLGGCHSGCDATSDVTNRGRFIGLGSVARSGAFSKRYDFGAGVKPTKLITRGTKQSGSPVSVNYSNNITCSAAAYDQPQSIIDIDYTGANALTMTLGTSRTLAQCFFLRYAIDETLSAVFPDSSSQTTISDFDLYFIANPGQQLRGGRTFINGADRGLNAQP